MRTVIAVSILYWFLVPSVVNLGRTLSTLFNIGETFSLVAATLLTAQFISIVDNYVKKRHKSFWIKQLNRGKYE